MLKTRLMRAYKHLPQWSEKNLWGKGAVYTWVSRRYDSHVVSTWPCALKVSGSNLDSIVVSFPKNRAKRKWELTEVCQTHALRLAWKSRALLATAVCSPWKCLNLFEFSLELKVIQNARSRFASNSSSLTLVYSQTVLIPAAFNDFCPRNKGVSLAVQVYKQVPTNRQVNLTLRWISPI